MTVIREDEEGYTAYVKGAADILLKIVNLYATQG